MADDQAVAPSDDGFTKLRNFVNAYGGTICFLIGAVVFASRQFASLETHDVDQKDTRAVAVKARDRELDNQNQQIQAGLTRHDRDLAEIRAMLVESNKRQDAILLMLAQQGKR